MLKVLLLSCLSRSFFRVKSSQLTEAGILNAVKIVSSRKDLIFMQSVEPLNVLLPDKGNEKKSQWRHCLNAYLLVTC